MRGKTAHEWGTRRSGWTSEIQGSLHYAADKGTVRRFGREDVLLSLGERFERELSVLFAGGVALDLGVEGEGVGAFGGGVGVVVGGKAGEAAVDEHLVGGGADGLFVGGRGGVGVGFAAGAIGSACGLGLGLARGLAC